MSALDGAPTLLETLPAFSALSFRKAVSPTFWFIHAFNFAYLLIQRLIVRLFAPPPPPSPDLPTASARKGRIAVIGAGLTGISSAAHAIAHGFDVVIYEQGDRIGGIWAHVNKSSGLQLNSLLYRFHPAVCWTRPFPKRDEILKEITRVWKLYQLEPRTKFDARVTKVHRVPPGDDADDRRARWTVNDGADGEFDAVVVTVGTCGAPMRIAFPGMPDSEGARESPASEGKHQGAEDAYAGEIYHSSELDDAPLEGKRVVVIGSGASGVEAVETALERGADADGGCVMIARQDKWIIPRNIVLDTLISAQPFGREMPLSFIWERIVSLWNYRAAPDLVPARLGIFESTPVVNDEFVGLVGSGKCKYVRGDIVRLTRHGVRVSVRGRDSKPGDDGKEEEFPADVVVLATGFEKPKIEFLEEDLFPEGYERPNLYLQNFSTEDWSVLMTNSAYQNAIGTVGHFHIGMYMRILLTFLMDPDARPEKRDMKLWVDVVRFLKRGARGGALGFFTYMELTIWLLLFHLFRLDRIKWLFFIMQGWGVYPDEYKHAKKGKGEENRREPRRHRAQETQKQDEKPQANDDKLEGSQDNGGPLPDEEVQRWRELGAQARREARARK